MSKTITVRKGKGGWLPIRRCEVSWGMDHQCYEPAVAFVYPSAGAAGPLAVCEEHSRVAERSNFRVERMP